MENDVCNLCPRRCGAVRGFHSSGPTGFCSVGTVPKVARAAPHFGEEPCISGKNGSGAVFFSGCNLGCIYCQNHEISSGKIGAEVTAAELRDIYFSLIAQKVHNINLVTPMHFCAEVSKSLDGGLPVPVICNTGGYDSIEAVDMLQGKIDVYLPDYKYSESSVAAKYSSAPDYPKVALEAIRAMCDAAGPLTFDDDGMITGGVIVRHMLIPGELDNTLGCIDAVASLPRDRVMLSLMCQYTPVRGGDRYENLSRRVTEEEYKKACDYALLCGMRRGYFQAPDAADESYIPPFDLTGVKKHN